MLSTFRRIVAKLHRAPVAPVISAPTPRITPRLAIQGARSVKPSNVVLRAHGVNEASVLDVVHVGALGVTKEATEALAQVYAEGGTRGLDAAAIATGVRPLALGEGLYFALVAGAQRGVQQLFAFVATGEPELRV